MARAACLVLVVAMGATPDISHLFRFGFQQGQPADPEKSAVQGTLPPVPSEPAAGKQQSPPPHAPAERAAHLSDASRMAIIRAISGEFVRAHISLPGGKQGLHVSASQPFTSPSDGSQPVNAFAGPHVYIAAHPPAIHQGDHVQITNIEFRDKTIVFDLNGGGKQKWHLRDHLQINNATLPSKGGPPGLEGQGATIFLDFDHRLPDVSPEELKARLAPILDFNRERSAAAQYAETLPPEFQKAIKDRMAAVGMDHDMVLAAMGRPDRKVRERDPDGNDTEDWIYGNPPERTVFVTFIGEKVVRVRQFP
jgi:hypothetical protein